MPSWTDILTGIGKVAAPVLGGWLGGKVMGSGTGDMEKYISALAPYGKQLVEQGTAAYGPPLDYWMKILAANRPELMSLLAPEVGRISMGYDQAAQSLSKFAPMGGGRAALLSELPFQKSRDISTLFQTARPTAAAAIPGIASSMVSGGTQAMYPLGNLMNFMLQKQAQQYETGKEVGGGIMDIISKLFGGKGSGGGSSKPPSTSTGGGGGGGSSPSGEPVGNFNWVPLPGSSWKSPSGSATSSLSYQGPYARFNPSSDPWPSGATNAWGVNPEWTDPEQYNPMAGWAGDPGYPAGWWTPVGQRYSPSGEPMP